MNLREGLLLAGCVGSLIGISFAESPKPAEDRIDGKKIELARYAKAFIGQGNVTVEIAPYKQGDNRGAILLFKGIESEWDGRAIPHDVVAGAYGGDRYVTKRNGKTWETLISMKGQDGTSRYELYVPGVKGAIELGPSDGAAQLTTPRKIFQEYQTQQTKK